jgi:nitrate/nitrite-specific signal transduction histidine kinase
MSQGLIVTELVINALKHAFGGHRARKIVVEYGAHGRNWTLSVSDNGIGMPSDSKSSKPGLGTNIVEAIAKRLDAKVRFASANPSYAAQWIMVHSVARHLGISDDEAQEAIQAAGHRLKRAGDPRTVSA